MFTFSSFPMFIENAPNFCPNLQKLYLTNLTPENFNLIFPVLPNFEKLFHLTIDHPKENLQEHIITIDNYMSNIHSLESLVLKNIKINIDPLAGDFSFKKLKILELQNNRIDPKNYKNLLFAISRVKTLKFLTISSNFLIKECGKYFVKLIDQLDNLEYLSLYNNEIDDCINLIVSKLKEKNSLAEFQLYNNKMNPNTLKEIATDLNWGKLDRIVISIGVDLEVINLIKKNPIRIFFRNNNLCLEEITLNQIL